MTEYYGWTLSARRLCIAAVCALLAILSGTPAAQAPATAPPYTVLSREGRRPLATRLVSGQEMFALDDLARLFDLTVREDAAAGGLTVTVRNPIIVLSRRAEPGLGRRPPHLAARAARFATGRTWLVPVDFVPRALAPTPRLPRRTAQALAADPRRRYQGSRSRRPDRAARRAARLTLDVAPQRRTPSPRTATGSWCVSRPTRWTPPCRRRPCPDLIQGVQPGDTPGRPDNRARAAIRVVPDGGICPVSAAPGESSIDVAAQTTEPAPQQAPAAGAGCRRSSRPSWTSPRRRASDRSSWTPGMAGRKTGAKGRGGTLEKNVTLSVARRLKAALETRLGVRVILTRDGDRRVGARRARGAREQQQGGSVHQPARERIDAGGRRAARKCFYFSLEEIRRRGTACGAWRHASRCRCSAAAARDIEVTPWEMARPGTSSESAALAQAVEASLREHVPMSSGAIRQGHLRVLVGANMPAVLVEMAFLSNPNRSTTRRSDEFQSAVVQGLVESITRFRGCPRRRTCDRPVHADRPPLPRPSWRS